MKRTAILLGLCLAVSSPSGACPPVSAPQDLYDIPGSWPAYKALGREVVRLLRLRPLVRTATFDCVIDAFVALLCASSKQAVRELPSTPLEVLYPLDRLPDAIYAGCGVVRVADPRDRFAWGAKYGP